MCEPELQLKFCTCDTYDASFEEPSEPYSWWTLEVTHKLPSPPIVGKVLDPFDVVSQRTDLTHDEIFSGRYIADQLNRLNLFDFDYVPKCGDRLFIELSGGANVALWFDDEWKCDERSPFEKENEDRRSYDNCGGLHYGSDLKEGYLEIKPRLQAD